MFGQKNVWSIQILAQTSFLGLKRIFVQKDVDESKKSWGPKKVGSKYFGGKIFSTKKIHGQNNVGFKKMLGQKTFWVRKNVGFKKNVGLENIMGTKWFWVKNNFRSKMNLGPRNVINYREPKIRIPRLNLQTY